MSKIKTLAIATLAFFSVIFSAEAAKLARVTIAFKAGTPASGRSLLHWLNKNHFDVAGVLWDQGKVEVIVSESGLKFLSAKKIPYETVQARTSEDDFENQIDPRYLNSDKVTQKLQDLHAAFPQITRLEQIGRSNEGRPVWALLISSTPNPKDPRSFEKPSIIFDGMHHAREIMTSEIVMDVAETLLKGVQAERTKALRLVDHWNIWVVPMLNVDGNAIVWSKDNWWRKNAKVIDGRVRGVDLNRNYEYRWASCDGSDGEPSSDTYRGDSPVSEPESRALMQLAQNVRPTAYLSYHSYSELILLPYGCDGEVTGENALLTKLANELASKLPSDQNNGSNYRVGTPWQLLYSVDGDSMSSMFALFGATALTFEVNRSFQPAYELREPTLQKHRGAWIYFLQRLDQNLLKLRVVDGRKLDTAVAQIEISTIKHQKNERPFLTNESGYFFKVLDPGQYHVRATLLDGRTLETDVDMQGRPHELTLTVP